MNAALVSLLLTGTVLLATGGARTLSAASWPHRHPRLGIAAWRGLTVSVLLTPFAAAVVAVMALVPVPRWRPVAPGLLPAAPLRPGPVVPPDERQHWLAALARLCLGAGPIDHPLASMPGWSRTAAVVALAVTVSIPVLRLAVVGHGVWRATRSSQRRHRAALNLVAELEPVSAALVLPHPRPAAYVLPGRRSVVVLTSGALGRLDPGELAAVLAHERDHLTHRHDRILFGAGVLQRTFASVGVFALAARELRTLVEMAADDAAVRVSGRRAVATAMVALGGAEPPIGTLGAGGADVPARIARLTRESHPPGAGLAAVAFTTALALAPVLVALTPAVAAWLDRVCPASGLLS
ncbi:Zn-dependent protease with chaperone function [Friedmanniella endophytica]|uniref:Zn-dependent protease with chaperone function n=1 Tax=Microlunatus kandeliicorticis TaxID=1759536 RepID=A0A7W3IPK8_9ACTN|nr:M56 family metallopeptidase [Microlunatus kandeliicorticis]MBA8792880.1 Zn-dependent protease with chaperone function [Microlunatus kandeliicorticis]